MLIERSSFALFRFSTAACRFNRLAAMSFGILKPSKIGIDKEIEAELLAEF